MDAPVLAVDSREFKGERFVFVYFESGWAPQVITSDGLPDLISDLRSVDLDLSNRFAIELEAIQFLSEKL